MSSTILTTAPLHQLSSLQLYQLYKLRCDIFVVEQECAYPEVDEYDLKALHFLLWEGEELLACARLLPPGVNYEQASIGRVAVRSDARGRGLARQMMHSCLNQAKELYPGETLKLQAQCYLEGFYASFGFETVSEPYPDAGIMHVDMLLGAER